MLTDDCLFSSFFWYFKDAIATCAQTLLRCLNHGAFNEILSLVSKKLVKQASYIVRPTAGLERWKGFE